MTHQELMDSDGWRAIKTAPKDGTLILCYGKSHGIYGYTSDRMIVTIAQFCNESFGYKKGQEHWSCESGSRFTPTHWMPLPRPPKENV